jgi:hypothetical protein
MSIMLAKLKRRLAVPAMASLLLQCPGLFAQSDITVPSDLITALSSNTPTAAARMPGTQGVTNAIDNVRSGASKYLNFDKLYTGLQITPASGLALVTGVALTSGGDSPERDPSSFTLEGSTDGGATFTLIVSNAVPAFTSRLQRQVLTFPNSAGYTTYRLDFPTVANAATANSMQITEIELLGVNYIPGPATVAVQPVSRGVVQGDKATFTVKGAGTAPYSYQWYSNAVAIAGATGQSYTTPPATADMNNTAYTVNVSNGAGNQTSSPATLTVVAPAANPGQFVADFNSGVVPAGSYVVGNAAVGSGGVGGSGVMKVTANANGAGGTYYVNDINGGAPVSYFKLSARVAIGGGTSRPADGMAFSFANNFADANFGEEGAGSGITVGFDTWDNNGDDTAPAIDVKWAGTVIAFKSLATNAGTQVLREGGRAPAGDILTEDSGVPLNLITYGPSPAVANDGSFVPLSIELFPDNTISVSWSNVVVFDHLPIPYTPLSTPQFAFGARTGGANANHLVDNLQIYANYGPGAVSIVTPPQNQIANETEKATFSVTLSGTPPYNIQWYSNNVAIAGANQPNYTTPSATTNMNGTVYRVDVSNAISGTPVSASANLTVIPAVLLTSVTSSNTANTVYVNFSKPVARTGLYTVTPGITVNSVTPGSNPNQVILSVSSLALETTYTVTVSGETATDGAGLKPNPSSALFRYGFGPICLDFNDNLNPPGSFMAGVATVAGGFVHLTDALNGVQGSFYLSNRLQGASLDRLQARWRSYVGDGAAGGADGYSFNWAPDLTPSAFPGEEGGGTGLSVTVDTWDNGGTDHAPGIQIKWKGTELAYKLISKIPTDNPTLRKSAFVDALVEVLPNGQATFNYDGNVVTATLPGFAPVANWNFQFSARTGGANDNMWIDDLRINCFSLGAPTFSKIPSDTNVIEGDAATFSLAVDGAPPLGLPQWLTNGVPAGVTGSTLTLPGIVANSGILVSAYACNDFGCSTSSPSATLTVTPAPRLLRAFMGCDPTVIHVIWSKPVQVVDCAECYLVTEAAVNGIEPGASPNEVLVHTDPVAVGAVHLTITGVSDTGNNVQSPATITASTSYGFGSFVSDFSSATLPAGAVLTGNAAVVDGSLHLTIGANDQCGSLFIPDLNNGANVFLLNAKWKMLVGGGNVGADGFSFNWAPDINAGSACPSAIEEGIGSGLSVTVDTFDNGCGDCSNGTDTGVEVKWKGTRIAYSHIPKNDDGTGVYLRKNRFVDVEVNVFPDGTAQLSYDGISSRATIPNYQGITGGKFLLGARTGGANDNHWVDDLIIDAVIPDTNGPVIYTPPLVTTNVAGASSIVEYSVIAQDLCSGITPIVCNPPSGSSFPVGQTVVNCTAQDNLNNASTASFKVIVYDTTATHITSIVKQLDGSQKIQFNGRAGQLYHVESTAELPASGPATWTDMGTATDLGGGTFEFLDATPALQTKFYRIRFP